ncbi:hypothetical protein NC651_008169 [Populus alba x Populus x berolinensis]|nr:hypothetical protein NC651_008169 [Populus alba x Populus x berolinensis]
MVIFGSREQLCVHEEVSLLRGKIQNNTCHLICRKREKYQCSHYSRVEDALTYHYLSDRGNKKSLTIEWDNNRLILDEGHNLVRGHFFFFILIVI